VSKERGKRHILLGVTGSIAAYKACDIASALVKMSYNITVAMTAEACKLITPLTFQAISRNPVITDMFAASEDAIPHISLADSIDLMVIAPASANIIGKIASGICDDILTCTAVSTRAKILLAPAMNSNMYTNAVVSENIAKLKRVGYNFVGPVKGRLACGYDGVGHIAPVEDIIKEIRRLIR